MLRSLQWFAYGDQLPGQEEIEEWLAGAAAAESARTRLRCARTFFRWCAENYEVTDATARLELPRGKSTYPDVLTSAQVRLLLSEAQRRSFRDYAIFLTLVDTGIRCGELHSLTLDSIGAGELAVTGKTGRRIVPCSRQVSLALSDVAAGQPGPIWRTLSRAARPMTRASLRDRIGSIMAAVITGPKLGPHILRHTFATTFLRNGGDLDHLRRILGHASIHQTTVYLHLVNDDLKQAHARYSTLASLAQQHTLEAALWNQQHKPNSFERFSSESSA